jgi:glycosyltransferase involved in cell wall biosynthesis
MDGTSPRVSVGLVVYNGEDFLREAIDALLAQTFQDFELIISDNASTDSTEQICREYAAKDQRIRYFRNEQNIGVARNFNRVIELAKGEYFKLAAHDDICAPDFLLKCVEVLDRDPSVVLCYTRIQIIDGNGKILWNGEDSVNSLAADSSEPHKRFYELIRHSNHHHQGIEVYGVIRMSALRQTPLFGYFVYGDRVLSARLSLLGLFHQIPEPLFLYRNHSNQTSVVKKRTGIFNLSGPTPTLGTWDPTQKGKIYFPEWRLWREYSIAIDEADLSPRDRFLCHVYLWRRLFINKNWTRLIRDVLIAIDRTISSMGESLKLAEITKKSA